MKTDIEKQIDLLSLEEKASLCSGEDCWHTKEIPEKGIPAIRMCDGPSGLRFQTEEDDHMGVHASAQMVSFPTGCAMASTFDRDMMRRVGQAIGQEARSVGVHLVLGPAANIKRNPLCGRNFEYLSEDPYLTGEMSAAQIQGIQGEGVGACMKHYACNNQETWRMKINAQVGERALREIYLSGFETAVKKAKPAALMASYNKVNGEAASENHHLLTEILRDDWGFEGFVVSDWAATNDRAAAVLAGMDLEMPGCNGITDKQLLAAVQEGRLDEQVLARAAARVTRQAIKFSTPATEQDFDREGHHALAVEAAAEGAVLLKNEGDILPLRKGDAVAFIGRFAEAPRYQGGGSACVTPFRVVSAMDAAAGIPGITYAPGFTELVDEENALWRQEAIACAKKASAAVIFAGLPDTVESESYDRQNLCLPACQTTLIREICSVQPNVVVVMCSGSPVEMPWLENVKAVLQMHTGGQGVGAAAVDLLYGDRCPCGKLAETYPCRLEDTPSYLNYPGDGKNVSYSEGVFVGYRYYDKKKAPVLFPFGHGLSYTSFRYENLRLSQEEIAEEDILQVQVDVTNTGSVFGQEVVQLYVEDLTDVKESWQVDLNAQVRITQRQELPARPVRELRGFEKVALAPGQTATVSFALDRRSFAWFDEEENRWRCTGGKYRICAASSSRDIRLTADVLLRETRSERPMKIEMGTLMSEVHKNPQLWEVALSYLTKVNPKLDEIINGTEATAMYLKEELKELPIYAVRGLYAVEQEYIDTLIEMLNRILEQQR